MKTAIILLAFFAIPFLSYSAEWEVKKDGITYRSDDGSTCYTVKAEWDLAEANIPSEVEGRKVTSIGYFTFNCCKFLESVSIPASVVSIDSLAFMHCESLVEITIPENVSSINASSFRNCSGLQSFDVDPANKYYCSVDGALYNADKTCLLVYPYARTGEFQIPEGISDMGHMAFWGSKVESVAFPSTLQRIPDGCFFEAVLLKEIIFPEDCHIKEIGEQSFIFCKCLESVGIPESVLSIGSAAFACCESLVEIKIPESVSSINDTSFSECISLQSFDVDPANKYYSSVDGVLYNADKTYLLAYPNAKTGEFQIPEGVSEIGPASFRRTKVESVAFPSTLQSIPDGCFCEAGNLKEIIFPEDCHIKEIGTGAFFECGLRQLILPSSLEKIGREAFMWNFHLTELWLPESVKLTEGHEFEDCLAIEEVHIKTEEPYQTYAFVFYNHTPKPRYLFVPKGCRENYEEYKCWTNLFYILEEGQDRSEAGIENIEMDKSEDRAYDLMGRKARNGHNGRIQILNGKKVLANF